MSNRDNEARIRAAVERWRQQRIKSQGYIEDDEMADFLRDLLTEAEERGKWVECPECRDGIGCATCGELDTAARGRIRRELKGALWMDDEYHGKHGRRYLSGINQGGRTARDVAREKWGER